MGERPPRSPIKRLLVTVERGRGRDSRLLPQRQARGHLLALAVLGAGRLQGLLGPAPLPLVVLRRVLLDGRPVRAFKLNWKEGSSGTEPTGPTVRASDTPLPTGFTTVRVPARPRTAGGTARVPAGRSPGRRSSVPSSVRMGTSTVTSENWEFQCI